MSKNIAYVKHPVTAKEKRELVNKGFKIIDIRFKPVEVGKNDKVIDKVIDKAVDNAVEK